MYAFIENFTAWKVPKYGAFSGPYFPVFGLRSNLRIQSECRKIRAKKTPYLDTFHAVTDRAKFKKHLLFCIFIYLSFSQPQITQLLSWEEVLKKWREEGADGGGQGWRLDFFRGLINGNGWWNFQKFVIVSPNPLQLPYQDYQEQGMSTKSFRSV